jgi:hypothetical protein
MQGQYDYLNQSLKNGVGGHGLAFSGSGYAKVVGSCENGNEPA